MRDLSLVMVMVAGMVVAGSAAGASLSSEPASPPVVRTFVGTDGAWNQPRNWSPEGVPAPGDTARFDAAATVTGPVPLTGSVVVDVSAETTVTFAGTVSGAGGLVKTGDGSLILTGNNTFAGNFAVSNGVARARGWNALGDTASGSVEIHAANRGTSLYLGGVHVRKNLVLKNCDDQGIGYHQFFQVESGTTNLVSGELSIPHHYLRMQTQGNARLDFTGGGSFGGNSAFLHRATGAEIRVLGRPMSIVNRYSSDLRNGWLVLAAPGCSMVDYSTESQICNGYRRLEVDGALTETSAFNGGTDSKLELCGTRQRLLRIFGRDPSRPGTVTSERPASLTFTDTVRYTNTCVFSGQVALTLAGASSQPVTLTGASTSLGTLTVEAGKTLRFALDGSWRGGVVVKGRVVAENASALSNAAFVDVWDGGSVEGTNGSFRDYRENGVSQATGTRRTYVGTNGKWMSAANWSPAGVPTSGDTVFFPSTTTISESFDLPGGVTRLEEASSATVTLSGVVGGAEATLVHAGTSGGTLILSGTNTFTGAFTNLSGTVKIPWCAEAGCPSPLGAGQGRFAEIYNDGVFWLTGGGVTDRPYRGGDHAQWNLDGTLEMNGAVAGRTWWRNNGTIYVNAPCSGITTFSRTDGGRVYMRCPTNDFTANVSFSAGWLVANTLADQSLPSSIGRGSSIRLGQAGYPTPPTLAYEGLTNATCNRALEIQSCNGQNPQYPARYANHDGPTFYGFRKGVTARYTGPVSLMNADAAHPFINCGGPGDTELTTAIPHRFHLFKSGTGTWTLGGDNAATGNCEVTEGRLNVNGALAAGMPVTVASEAVLGGAGTVHGPVSLAAGAVLAAGSATTCGTLTIAGRLVMATGTELRLKYGADACDGIETTGALDLPSDVPMTLTALDGGRLSDGEYCLWRWRQEPATTFTLTARTRGLSLERRTDGLFLHVARNEDFQTARRSAAEPYEVTMTAEENLTTLKERVRGILGGGVNAGRPVTVLLKPGDYVIDSPLVFSAADSGTMRAPVVWRAAKRGTVRILGARPLDPQAFRPLAADDPVRFRVPSAAVDQVRVMEVGSFLPTTLPDWGLQRRTPPAPWLFLGGRFQDLARWPNRTSEDEHGWTTFTECTSLGTEDKTGVTFVTLDNRPARWNFTEGVWLYGYWGQTWDENYIKAAGWNSGTRELTLAGKPNYLPTLGTWQAAVRRYVALNLPEEMDAPGEWWLDRGTRRLYYIPPADFGAEELVLCANSGRLVSLAAGTHDLAFENIGFAYAGNGFATDGEVRRISFDACDFHSFMGGSSLNGSGCAVRRSSFAHLGQNGLGLTGGDRARLTRGLNVVEDCDFTDFEHCQQTYAPAVNLQGCGNSMRGCRAWNSAHEAVTYGGNEHFVGWCEFHHVLRESADCGAIYTGRNTSTLGTQLVGNFFHDLKTGDVTGIYFDDCDWGDDAIANTFQDVYRAFMVGGGNLHRLQWNQMKDCTYGLHVDRRGVTWDGRSDWVTGDDWCFKSFTGAGIDYTSSIWTAAYPELAATLLDDPRNPWNNDYIGNLFQDCTTWTTLQQTAPTNNYYPGVERMVIAGNVTASTTGKNGTGITGFTHLGRAATPADVPGMEPGLERVAELADAPVAEVTSPDGSTCVRVGLDVTARLCCRAECRGEEVLGLSPMGVTVDGVDYGRMMAPQAATMRTVAGERAVDDPAVSPGYAELLVPLEGVVDGNRLAQVEIRAFTDGFAYRFRVAGEGERNVAGEFAQWRMSETGGLQGSALPAGGWTVIGEVVTPWNVLKTDEAAITNGVLFIDVPPGESRALTIAERTALTSDAVTGAVKTGGGTLQLSTSLEGYTGTWVVSNGYLAVSTPQNAFGSGGTAAVRVIEKKNSGGAALTFSGNVVVDRPLNLVCDDYRIMEVQAYAMVRFLRQVTCTGSLSRINYGAGSRTVYAGGFVQSGSITAINGSGEEVFEATPSRIFWLYAQGSATTRFNCPSNAVDKITCAYSSGGLIVQGCADALAGNSRLVIDDTTSYVIDLAGHDLTTGAFNRFSSGELTSSAGPAKWRFGQANRITNENCAVTGKLTLSKTGSGEFALARPVESRGGLEVDQGVFRMTRVATWPHVAYIDVSGSGTLIVEGDDAFGNPPYVRISGNGRIQVPSGVTLECNSIRRNGSYLAAGVYTSSSGFVTGGGQVRAGPPPGTMFLVR